MRHQTVINVRCLMTMCRSVVRCGCPPEKLLLKWTTTDRSILSTYCFTLLEVPLNMIVLPATQVLSQSSTGIDSRASGKASVESSLPACTGVSSMSELISSVINDGNVRFMSNTNAGNLRFPTDINVDRIRRGNMCV